MLDASYQKRHRKGVGPVEGASGSKRKLASLSKTAFTPKNEIVVDKGNESAAAEGVTKHYFKRYYNFENLLMGTTMKQRVNDDLGATLRSGTHGGKLVPQASFLDNEGGFVSGPVPFKGPDMTDLTNPIPSLFPPQAFVGNKRVISLSNRRRLHNNNGQPALSINEACYTPSQVQVFREKRQSHAGSPARLIKKSMSATDNWNVKVSKAFRDYQQLCSTVQTDVMHREGRLFPN